MQHHAHVARTAPPHIRAHHMAVPPPHSQPQQAHMPPLNMAHAPPPPTTGQQQQQQKQQQHLTNGPAPGGSAAVITGSVIGAPTHLRDHQSRLSQQPLQQRQSQHAPLMHNSTQLQKLRQQHQHINTNSNSTNKTNYHHHQQPQQYNNGASNTHGNALPAQSAIQQQQQHQQKQTTSRHPSTHQHQHQHQQHPLRHQQQHQQQQPQPPQQQQPPLSVTQMPPQQALGHLKHQQPLQQAPVQQHQQQQLQTTLHAANNVISGHLQQPPPQPTQHAQQPPATLNYYTAGVTQGNSNNVHKSKYNSNLGGGVGGSSGGMPPKTILQNPNRVLKARLHSSAAANNIEVNIIGSLVSIEEAEKVDKDSGSGKSVDSGDVNNVNTATEAPVKANVGAAINESAVIVATTGTESLKILETRCQNGASCNEANKENVANGALNANTSNEVIGGNTTNNNNINNILSNEDSIVPKNSKEKTPMCLVNELARFNKITHQYRLTSEKGPAHSKRFTVTLKLGEEEYSAEGFKIKKAQHLAAGEAIEKTKYKHPVPKVIRRNADGDGNLSRSNITPTVELNALAMKLGQETYYLLDPRQVAPPDTIGPPPDAMMAQRYGVHPPPPLHALPPPGLSSGHMLPQLPPPPPHVRMMDPPAFVRRNGPYAGPPPPPLHGHPVGGPGMRSRYGAPAQRSYMPKYGQQQRYPLVAPTHMSGGPHNGIAPPPLPHPHHGHHGLHSHRYGMPAVLTKVTLVVGKQKFVGLGYTVQQAKHDAAARALLVLKAQPTTQLPEALNNSLEESDSKSPISLVHEIGIQRSLTVHFKVLREQGPAHMKKFVTACVVGSIVTEGEGNGKKISKKRAAEKMLEELKKLPPVTPTKSPVKRIKVKTSGKGAEAGADAAGGGGERRKRGSGSIKEKSEVDADAENPITRLIQLQQNRKEKEPLFELIAKNGNENSRRREFIMEVTAHGMVARGTGNSKKLAKRNAAQNLLIAMGENSSDGVGAVGSANIQAADKENYAPATATTTEITAATSKHSQKPPNTVLQPIAELSAPAAVVEAHLDLPHVSTPAGQVPGILILRHNKKHATKKKECASSSSCLSAEDSESKRADLPLSTTLQTVQPAALKINASSIVKESEVAIETTCAIPPSAVAAEPPPAMSNVPNTASSATSGVTTTTSSSNSTSTKQAGVHMKDQLLYLAKLLGFEVNFSDYPKGNHSEFLTIVTLSSNPPQICHGVGTSAEESQNDAARNALKILSELGLNNAMK